MYQTLWTTSELVIVLRQDDIQIVATQIAAVVVVVVAFVVICGGGGRVVVGGGVISRSHRNSLWSCAGNLLLRRTQSVAFIGVLNRTSRQIRQAGCEKLVVVVRFIRVAVRHVNIAFFGCLLADVVVVVVVVVLNCLVA